MKVTHNDPNLLIVETRPWILGLLFGVGRFDCFPFCEFLLQQRRFLLGQSGLLLFESFDRPVLRCDEPGGRIRFVRSSVPPGSPMR